MSELNLQAMVDGWAMNQQRERAEQQMTLGELIYDLNKLKLSKRKGIRINLSYPHSYRGYYCDLAFERDEKGITVNAALKMCQKCMGEVFTGYKGGDFMMGRNTPVWIAGYGFCGDKIMEIGDDGELVLAKDEL